MGLISNKEARETLCWLGLLEKSQFVIYDYKQHIQAVQKS